MNKENQENLGKKSNGDMSESVKAVVRTIMAEEFAKFKAGPGSGAKPSTSSGLLCS